MKRDEPYLQDIYAAIKDIEKFTEKTNEEQFLKNKEKQYAVMRAIEIIGEATKNMSRDLKTKYPDVPWKIIAGMRDKLIHAYFGVKPVRVWEVTQKDIPKLKKQIAEILKEIK